MKIEFLRTPLIFLALVFCGNAVCLAQTAQEFFSRGVLQYKNKQYREAIVNFSESIRLSPNSSEAWFNRGQSYYFSGNMDSAIQDYTRALSLRPNSVDILFQ